VIAEKCCHSGRFAIYCELSATVEKPQKRTYSSNKRRPRCICPAHHRRAYALRLRPVAWWAAWGPAGGHPRPRRHHHPSDHAEGFLGFREPVQPRPTRGERGAVRAELEGLGAARIVRRVRVKHVGAPATQRAVRAWRTRQFAGHEPRQGAGVTGSIPVSRTSITAGQSIFLIPAARVAVNMQAMALEG